MLQLKYINGFPVKSIHLIKPEAQESSICKINSHVTKSLRNYFFFLKKKTIFKCLDIILKILSISQAINHILFNLS